MDDKLRIRMSLEEVLTWAREVWDPASHTTPVVAVLYIDGSGCCCVCTGEQHRLRDVVKTFNSHLNDHG